MLTAWKLQILNTHTQFYLLLHIEATFYCTLKNSMSQKHMQVITRKSQSAGRLAVMQLWIILDSKRESMHIAQMGTKSLQ